MQIEEYLKKYQPICYRVFSKSLEEGKLNHAYLLAGEKGVPLKQIALFLAKSILCDHPRPFADDECIICHRVDEGTYVDLMVLDGEEESIKKNDVIEVTSSFSKTSMENKGIMIYIINLAEKMTAEAINSLLKFLEEPTPGTYAILTTQNSARILPTIISRCEVIRLNAMPRAEVLSGCKELNVPENHAELMSFFYGAPELVAEKSQSEEADELPNLLTNVVTALAAEPQETIFLFQSKIIPAYSSKVKAATLIDLLTIVYHELVNRSLGFEPMLPSYSSLFRRLDTSNPDKLRKKLDFLLGIKTELDLNVNPALLLDHIIITLTKEEQL